MADVANGTVSFDEYANGAKIAGQYVNAFIDKADLTVKKGGSVTFTAGATLAIGLDVGTLPASIQVSLGGSPVGTLTLITGRVYKFGAKDDYIGADATITGSTGSFKVNI